MRAVSVNQPAHLDQFQAEYLDLVEHTGERAGSSEAGDRRFPRAGDRASVPAAGAVPGAGAGTSSSRFAGDFTGSERTVTEHLLAEVLDRQPDDARRLLLRTSLLDRGSGQLADALTGETNGQRILKELEGAGGFVLAIDPQRLWYPPRSAVRNNTDVRHGEVEPLIELLTDAEIRVLRYVPTNPRAPEIACELCVSINTVRTHLRHLHAKLDVSGRTDAVERARRLGLLSSSRGGR